MFAFQAETKGNQMILTVEKMPENPIEISFAQGSWYQINLFNSAGISNNRPGSKVTR